MRTLVKTHSSNSVAIQENLNNPLTVIYSDPLHLQFPPWAKKKHPRPTSKSSPKAHSRSGVRPKLWKVGRRGLRGLICRRLSQGSFGIKGRLGASPTEPTDPLLSLLPHVTRSPPRPLNRRVYIFHVGHEQVLQDLQQPPTFKHMSV